MQKELVMTTLDLKTMKSKLIELFLMKISCTINRDLERVYNLKLILCIFSWLLYV